MLNKGGMPRIDENQNPHIAVQLGGGEEDISYIYLLEPPYVIYFSHCRNWENMSLRYIRTPKISAYSTLDKLIILL